jgi:hypothetical protein
MRIKAMAECNIVQVDAKTDLFQRFPQSSSATIRLKRHPVGLAEVATHPSRFDPQGAKERIGVFASGITFNTCEKV